MEQAPDELSGHEGETSDEELDKLTSEPMNSPDKAKDAEEGAPGAGGSSTENTGG
jgi:hypothetical protein